MSTQSELPKEILHAIRELIRLDNSLRETRKITKKLETERQTYRTTILNYYHTKTHFKTPYGDVIVRLRETHTRFSLEDIRDIVESSHYINDTQKQQLILTFEHEAERNIKMTRTLSVKRPQTYRKQKRTRHKTAKNTHEDISHETPFIDDVTSTEPSSTEATSSEPS